MGGLAILARNMGHKVSGSDTNPYPPMSTLLAEHNIEVSPGYRATHLSPRPDLVVVGNALSRGNKEVEAMLEKRLPYTSGPEWLYANILKERKVVAVAGTHGKTTTSAMLAHILDQFGLAPGFLIGGVPGNFDVSARPGKGDVFVVEADEYDTAFFDKRSKFVHYRPDVAVLNNLEFDHADIFADLAAIQTQFHHLIRTVPSSGRLILPHGETALEETLEKGCWSEIERFGENDSLGYRLDNADGSAFTVLENDEPVAQVRWDQTGRHSVNNGMAALLAARHVGVTLADGAAALCEFQGVKRRMELRGEIHGVRVYDDFAHHPTAIATTLDGLRRKVGDGKILAVIEPRSNTMRMGSHKEALAASTGAADEVIWYQPPGLDWSLDPVVSESPVPASVNNDIDDIIARVVARKGEPLNVVVMSNGGFGGIHQKLLEALKA